VLAQDVNVSGTILDASGSPMPGVNVIVKGKTISAVSDVNGNYNIKCTTGDVLTFSFIGFQQQEITVGTNTTINIKLSEDIQQLNEVVVIGYGVQKKSDLTGAVASVNAKDLKNMPITRVDEALQGKAAGVQIFQNSGQPGSEPKIRVRGLATVNGGNPLVVIDGVAGGSISSINPSDIESMEILKDAASQSIYGSAGGNGVILITTKRGKASTFNANLDMFWGSQQPWSKNNVKIADAQQYAAIYNSTPAGKDYFPKLNGVYMDHNDSTMSLTNTNWVNKVFRPSAMLQNYNVSINGGTKKTNAYASFGYSNEEGTVLKTENNKYTLRLNTDVQVHKRIKIGESFTYSQSKDASQDERNEYSSPLSSAIQMLPIVPVYATDTSGNYAYRNSGLSSNTTNPLAQIEFNNNQGVYKNFFGNVYVKIDILTGLSFESHYGINNSDNEYRRYNPKHDIGSKNAKSASQSVANNSYQLNTSSGDGWQFQNFLNYSLQLTDMHKLDFLAGMESGAYTYKFTNKNFANINLGETAWQDYSDTTGMQILADQKKPQKGYAYFGRINYDLAGILLIQGNIRRDYSSKFGPKQRVGTFPSVSAGIKFSEFEIIKDIDIIDFGKIRYGYGETGNSDIQPFLYESTYGTVPINGYAFGSANSSQKGISLLTAGNADLHWETVVTSNFGIDLGILKNRLTLSIDYFTRKNKDMLLRKSVVDFAGLRIGTGSRTQELGDNTIESRPLVNYGVLDNSGLEFTLGFKDKIGDFNYEFNGNLTKATTKITDIGDPLYSGGGRGITNICRTKNDGVVSAFYGYKIKGIYKESDFVWVKAGVSPFRQYVPDATGTRVITGTDVNGNPITINTYSTTAKPGFFKFEDTNGDGSITPDDMVAIGDPNPDFTYGFGANFEYKGIDLSMFFQGSYGNDIFNLLKVNLYSANNGGLNWSTDLINAYIPATYSADKTTVLTPPRNENTGIQSMDAELSASEFYVEDGSYLRLKNIQLGYTLPGSLTKKAKLEKLRVYVGAKNLLTFTNYTGFDPEVGENTAAGNSILERGLDRGTYPQSKMFLVGLNLTF
jgi:TonB-linked SusC/RagA family outer membrane protein